MKKIVVSIGNGLLAEAITQILTDSGEFQPFRFPVRTKKSDIVVQCEMLSAETLIAEVSYANGTTIDTRLAEVKELRKKLPNCKIVLLCDENSAPDIAHKVMLAKKRRTDRLLLLFFRNGKISACGTQRTVKNKNFERWWDMNMACVQSTAVNLFDEYCLLIPPKLKSYQDGPPGQRVMFITDQKENFIISFEEGMKPMDTISEGEGVSTVSYQCQQNGKYIHLQRRSENPIRYAFFHLELEDNNGTMHVLPGQMVIYTDYTWSDGIEPVLMELLSGITSVC